MLGGWLYAYELPVTSLLPTTRRSDSPDEQMRRSKLDKVKRDRTLSLMHIEESRAKAARVRERLAREGLRARSETRGDEERGGEVSDEEIASKRRKVVIEVREQGSEVNDDRQPEEVLLRGRGVARPEDSGMEMGQLEDSDEMSNQQNGSANGETYVFAVHRRRVCEDG